MFDDPFQKNVPGKRVSPVKIHGTDQGFESITL